MTAAKAVERRTPSDRANHVPAGVHVLYVQAPGHARAGMADRLGRFGYAATMASDAGEALRLLIERPFVACVLDLAGDRASMTVVRLIRARHDALPLVGIVDPTLTTVAADALRSGVVDLLPWPFEDHEMAAVLADIRARTPERAITSRSDVLVAHSASMRELMSRVRGAAATRHAVWLAGQPGTGKRRLARALHDASAEPRGTFVEVDCASRAPSEVERELFGADDDAEMKGGVETISEHGAVARARGGSLLVTNIDEAPVRVQVRLAALLRDREVRLRESQRLVDLNVRLIATVNDAETMNHGNSRIRRELADRFVVHLDVPPLHRRREDVPLLAVGFLERAHDGQSAAPRAFSRAALELLAALPWPGNVTELRHVVETLAAGSRKPIIQLSDVLECVKIDGTPHIDTRLTLRESKEQFERDCISAVLASHHGRVGEAARALGIQRTNLYRKVRQLGISRALLSSHR